MNRHYPEQVGEREYACYAHQTPQPWPCPDARWRHPHPPGRIRRWLAMLLS